MRILCVALLIMVSGCASNPQRNQRLSPSDILLSPIAFSGDLAHMAGSGLHQISKPAAPSRPTHFDGTPTTEQLDALANISVAYVPGDQLTRSTGQGAGAWTYNDPIRTFLVNLEHTAGVSFDWRVSPQLQDIAMSFPGGIIVFNPAVMGQASLTAQYLMGFHEISHHLLGHTSYGGPINGFTQPWLQKSKELDADRRSARLMLRANFTRQQILYAAMELYGSNPEGPLHPHGSVRVAAIKDVLSNY